MTTPLELLLSRPLEDVSDEDLRRSCLSFGTQGYQEARKAGRLDLIAKLFKTGFWPTIFHVSDPFNPHWEAVKKPKSLQHAFYLLLKPCDADSCPLFMAYVMTYDMNDVMALVVGSAPARVVVTIYNEKDLHPYISTNRHLKAALLESTMGL
jgi:hypothetical protein